MYGNRRVKKSKRYGFVKASLLSKIVRQISTSKDGLTSDRKEILDSKPKVRWQSEPADPTEPTDNSKTQFSNAEVGWIE